MDYFNLKRSTAVSLITWGRCTNFGKLHHFGIVFFVECFFVSMTSDNEVEMSDCIWILVMERNDCFKQNTSGKFWLIS